MTDLTDAKIRDYSILLTVICWWIAYLTFCVPSVLHFILMLRLKKPEGLCTCLAVRFRILYLRFMYAYVVFSKSVLLRFTMAGLSMLAVSVLPGVFVLGRDPKSFVVECAAFTLNIFPESNFKWLLWAIMTLPLINFLIIAVVEFMDSFLHFSESLMGD